jgi:hypothetical protein
MAVIEKLEMDQDHMHFCSPGISIPPLRLKAQLFAFEKTFRAARLLNPTQSASQKVNIYNVSISVHLDTQTRKRLTFEFHRQDARDVKLTQGK